MPSPSSLPLPVRAALGLAATVLDEARHLPDKAIELPMRAVSRALQLSLRAQQRYAALAARGDELLSGRQTTDEPPSWANFDDPIDSDVDATAGLYSPELDAADLTDDADDLADDAPEPRRPKPRPAKTVRAPRSRPASAFDAVVEPGDGDTEA